MKKIITAMGFGICTLITNINTVFAQDIIVSWTFPNSSADAIADAGMPENSARFISCERGSGFTVLPITYTSNGAEYPTVIDDKSATASGFDNGADSAYWMVKFKTVGHSNIKVSSKQWSGASPAGPKNFKLQYKLSGTSVWNDLTTITLANDWTTGILNEYVLPTNCENSSSNISLRWIMSSNIDINGGSVVHAALTGIDDIIITGNLISGVNESIGNANIASVYPNPNKGAFIIECSQGTKDIKIFNLLGKCVYEKELKGIRNLSISDLSSGIYFLQINSDENILITKKVVVE